MIIINSYDGAEHSKNHKSKTSLISFSSQLFNEKIIQELGYSTTSPNNILTWMKLRRPEKPQNVLPVTMEVCKEIKTIQEYPDNIVKEQLDGKHFSIYEVSDGKMLYMVLQHSLYSRFHKPYLLCTCLRGEGVRDKSHKCRMIPHDRQVELYTRSLNRWERQTQRQGAAYTKKKHMDWVDVEND